jgi:hypothetical protein
VEHDVESEAKSQYEEEVPHQEEEEGLQHLQYLVWFL